MHKVNLEIDEIIHKCQSYNLIDFYNNQQDHMISENLIKENSIDSFLEESSNSIENKPYSSKFIESRLEREV